MHPATESVAFPRKLFHPVTRVLPSSSLHHPSPRVPVSPIKIQPSTFLSLSLSLFRSPFLNRVGGKRRIRDRFLKVGDVERRPKSATGIEKRGLGKEEEKEETTRLGIEIRSETRRWPAETSRNEYSKRKGGPFQATLPLLAELVTSIRMISEYPLTATFAKHRSSWPNLSLLNRRRRRCLARCLFCSVREDTVNETRWNIGTRIYLALARIFAGKFNSARFARF